MDLPPCFCSENRSRCSRKWKVSSQQCKIENIQQNWPQVHKLFPRLDFIFYAKNAVQPAWIWKIRRNCSRVSHIYCFLFGSITFSVCNQVSLIIRRYRHVLPRTGLEVRRTWSVMEAIRMQKCDQTVSILGHCKLSQVISKLWPSLQYNARNLQCSFRLYFHTQKRLCT